MTDISTLDLLLAAIAIILVVIELRNTARHTGLTRLLSDMATMIGDLLDPERFNE